MNNDLVAGGNSDSSSTSASPSAAELATQYGPDYYNKPGRVGPVAYTRETPEFLQFSGHAADEIVRRLRPRTVLDVGCGKGFLVESLRDRGVEAYGFDVSEYAISEVRPDMRPYCWVGSASAAIDKDYDLITCIEVCEHLPESDAHEAVRQMTSHADTILFSSTPSDFTEPTHVNVRPVIDWVRLFASLSFAPDLAFDAGFIAPQAILFRRVQKRPPDQELCRFANFRNQAIAIAQIQQEQAEKNALLDSQRSNLEKLYRKVRFRVKHPIAQVLRKLNLIQR
jgi:2-polyprenyl-3-methyl-5-hydroxy-6-metoxy-1,4-benzoquinol methylase